MNTNKNIPLATEGNYTEPPTALAPLWPLLRPSWLLLCRVQRQFVLTSGPVLSLGGYAATGT